jgi:hypothetical protein
MQSSAEVICFLCIHFNYVMRIPLEGGGRLVVEMYAEEANNLSAALHAAVSLVKK